ncbi:MAG TPA: peptidase S10 [Thermoanaerobaculia bacterium]|nr:peptidase S10 [Thermoanaerobaculia bacterium]
MPTRSRIAGLFAFVLLFLPCLLAAEGAGGEANPPEKPAAPASSPKEFVTHHTVEIGGKTLRYRAVAGETFLKDAKGTPKASIFSVSYLLDGVDAPSARPITFLFNGGPGSTATWLHIGAFGPVRLNLGDDPLDAGSPPYPLRPNVHSLLDVSDLVFVDPIGTGYSHALGEGKDSEYWGVDEDAASMASFIRSYLTHQRRWTSPKYLAGESYGTIRASVLVRDLSLDVLDGVAFNGVILISTAVDVRVFLSGAPGNDIAYATGLPTYAATAYYHNQLPEKPANREAFLAEAREFAATEYLTALFKGDALSDAETAAVAAKLHRFTGLSEAYLRRSHLRVPVDHFLKELLRDRGEVLGIHDTRFRGKDPDEAGELVAWDPFLFGIAGPFVSAINGYLTDDLKVDMGESYEVFQERAGGAWKRPAGDQNVFSGFLNTTGYLSQAAATNRDFRIFVAGGYYDLTTTFYGVEQTFNHSGIPKDRITLKTYEGGHMMYLREASLTALSADIRAFIRGGK